MNVDELQQLIRDRVTGGVLALRSADFGAGAAARLVTQWLGGTLTLRGVRIREVPTGVVVSGTMSFLKVADQPVTDVVFALDPGDRTPSLFLPFPVPADWSFGTSFPETADSPLAALGFAAAPELLLTSVRHGPCEGRPALAPGLTFHAAKAEPPAELGALAALLPLSSGTLPLTGPITYDQDKPLIQLSSPLKEGGGLGVSFFLWGGSRSENGALGYGVRLAARLTLAPGAAAAVSAPVQSGVVVLGADELPAALSVKDLGGWGGSQEAVRKLTGQGFALGDTVRLSELSVTLDPAGLPDLKKVITKVAVRAQAQPEVAWEIAGDRIRVTEVGAELEVGDPLGARSATVTGYGDFTVAQSVRMTAKGEIPPGTMTLSLAPGTTAKLADVVQHFLPSADLSGAPEITLQSFTGTATPKAGDYSVRTEVGGEVRLPLGAAHVTLTGGTFELTRQKKEGKEKPEEREGGTEGAGTHETKAALSATAKLAPLDRPASGVDFTAVWEIPGSFALTGKFPDIGLTELLRQLAADTGLVLPDGLPALTLRESQATVRLGQGYELALRTTVDVDGRKAALLGKAARHGKDSGSTVFTAVIWQDGWSWSPRDVAGWAEPLKILGDIGFRNSGLALCTADGQQITGDGLPATLPEELGKGLTFFTEITFGSALAFLHTLFPGATSIKLRALLAAEIARSSFTAVIGENETLDGLGRLSLTVVPATFTIELATTFVLTLGPDVKLQFIGGGAVKLSDGAWTFSLSFVLKPAATAAGLAAGELEPHQQAVALDAPGHTLLTAVPRYGWDGRIIHDAGADQPFATFTERPATGQRPSWRNAFGIEGFDIRSFYLELLYSTGTFSLGGGGAVTVGSADLELAVFGVVDPPAVSAFYFKLAAASAGHGVSLHDLVRVVVPSPPPALDVLKKIVLNELLLCCVMLPGGWTNPDTKEEWQQGFYAKGDIDFFTNHWRFALRLTTNGVYARSEIAKPVEFGRVLTLSDTTGDKGPQFLLDLSDIKNGVIPKKILALSGKVTFLGLSVALDAELGTDGFLFDFAVDLTVFQATLKCAVTGTGLSAAATARLAFAIDPPSWTPFAGERIDVVVSGNLAVSAKADGVRVTLSASGGAKVGGRTLGSLTLGPLHLSIGSWDAVPDYFVHHPDVVFRALGEALWDTARDCAVKTASARL